MKPIRLLSMVGFALVLAAPALADPTPGNAATAIPSFMRLAGAFIAVVALVYVLSFVMRKAAARRVSGSTRVMDVVDVLPLGPKARLVTVKIAGQYVVVGAGESSVNRIIEIDPAAFHQDDCSDGSEVIPFRQRLRRLAGK